MLKKFRIPANAPKLRSLLLKTPAFAMLLIIALATSAFAQGPKAGLSVIYRDFKSDQWGFERNDQQQGANRQCAERWGACHNGNCQSSPVNRPEDAICFTGNLYHSCNIGSGTELRYGSSNTNGCAENDTRGYWNGPDVTPVVSSNNCWWQPVLVTRGMVQKNLDYSKCDGIGDGLGWQNDNRDPISGKYCARPMSTQNARCYGAGNVETWFSDGPDSKRYIEEFELKRIGQTGNLYEVDYSHNTRNDWGNANGQLSAGFFPLDKKTDSWGIQNCMVWPDESDNDKTPGRLNDRKCTAEKRHNYGFSMSGSGEFKYKAGANDLFKFIGDDDMWIFIDGELFEDDQTGAHADLGGNHLAAPAVIDIAALAARKGWTDGTDHVINFYYMERQTDGSNLYLKMALSDLKPSEFGFPRIDHAETVVGSDGEVVTKLFVTSKLDMGSIEQFKNGGIGFPILVLDAGKTNIYGYKLESIIDNNYRYEGFYTYDVKGTVCTDVNCGNTKNLSSGDSLSFNIYRGNMGEQTKLPTGDHSNWGLTSEDHYIKNTVGKGATDISWGVNKTKRQALEVGNKPGDPNPEKPDFPGAGGGPDFTGTGPGPVDPSVPPGAGGPIPGGSGAYNPKGTGNLPNIDKVWDSKTGNMVDVNTADPGSNNGNIHGFGTVGKQIPPQRAGELILTAFPDVNGANGYPGGYEQWLKDYLAGDGGAQYFGLPPQANSKEGGKSDAWWGIVDPTIPRKINGTDGEAVGGFAFVKNGFPQESNVKGSIKLAPSRCTSIINPGNPKGERVSINCLSFNLYAQQPFQLAVTVYDQLGNFVTQYRETVTEDEFRRVTQASSRLSSASAMPSASTGCYVPGSADYQGYGHPTSITMNGQVNVGVNIYPFSSMGRRFGNGVYIVKIDKVDIPFAGCQVLDDGGTDRTELPFARSHADQKFGWMRSK